MNTIKVRTTQNVELEYPIASIGDRILAYIIDGAVLLGWVFIYAIAAGLIQAGSPFSSDITSIIFTGIMLLPIMLYSLLCEIFMNGQTIGKRAKDIKVIKLSGAAPTIGDYLLRWLFRLIEITICYGVIAMITIAVNGKGQRLGDLAAGTSVIRTRTIKRKGPFEVKPEEGYEIIFPEVSLLSDKDLALIRKLLYKALIYQNEALLARLAERTREVLGVQSELADEEFIRTVIKDYYHQIAGVEA